MSVAVMGEVLGVGNPSFTLGVLLGVSVAVWTGEVLGVLVVSAEETGEVLGVGNPSFTLGVLLVNARMSFRRRSARSHWRE